MSDVALLAFGALSGLGEGARGVSAGMPGETARGVIARDEELVAAGLARPFAARAPVPPAVTDRAAWLVRRALEDCVRELGRVRPAFREERVGLVLGTSCGGMRRAEAAFELVARGESVADPEAATYFGPAVAAARALGVPLSPCMLVLGACASSVLALGLAARWLERGGCDVVLAGGFDDVTVFVATGFERLRATTESPPPRPFRVGRDGMSVGEGAAVLALARGEAARGRAYLTGFGAACDAVHITAPDREGRGLASAAAQALDEAGRPTIDLVSAHATATPFNDAMEAKVLRAVLPGDPVVHPFKAQIGHTLGAAGALESLAVVDALERGVLPAAAGGGPLDPEAAVRLLDHAEPGTPRVGLKLAAAFGGANAALVLSTGRGRPRPVRPSFLHGAAHVALEPSLEALEMASGLPLDRLARADALVRLALAAVARLASVVGPVQGAGIVVGSALATLETNARFAERIRSSGARTAEPRRFPYTSPNAVAGECSIAFGLTGPGFAVGGGLHAGLEALIAGALLVEGGDADRVVVVAADDVGPAAAALGYGRLRPGAVATLVSSHPEGAFARLGELRIERPVAPEPGAPEGHVALLPLLERPLPSTLRSGSPPDGSARVALLPV